MQVEFPGASSTWLAMLITAIVLLCGAGYVVARRHIRREPGLPGLSWRGVFFRAIAIFCALAALAQPVLVEEREERQAVVLLDVSDSMDAATSEILLARARELLPRLDTQLVPFSESAAKEALRLRSSGSFEKLRDDWGLLNIGQTNIEQSLVGLQGVVDRGSSQGLARSSGSTPVLILSDGYETRGDAGDVFPALREAGLPLYPLVPAERVRETKRFEISNLNVPLVAPAQKSVEIRASIQNTSTTTKSGLLRITHDDRVVREERITVAPGQELLVVAASDPSRDGIRKVVAQLVPSDVSDPPSERRAFLSGEAREKVLVLNGDEQDARFLAPVLKDQSYQLESLPIRPSSGVLSQLNQYSTVLLNNASMAQLPEGALVQLKAFVEGGGGLIVSGGNRSFGLGGYIGTALEGLLPVKMVPPQAEERRLNVAVQLVIDKSQSMSKDQRLEFAKEAAREVVQNLKDEDYIGVIGFDETPYEVLRTTQVKGNREYAVERVGRLFPKGQTWLLPALREARRRLEATPAGRKHMIIVTDGQLRDAGPVYLEDVRQARLLGITVSTVMIGGEFDFGFLRSLSDAGGGRFYSANDPAQLPRIFIQDVKVRSGEKTMKENEEFPVRFGSGQLRSTTVRSFPPLKGFVETRIKPEANYELAVASGPDLRPLLASWRVGKGQVIAYTSDNNGRWSADWVSWGKFAEFWSSLVDSARSKSDTQARLVRFDLRRFVERGALILDAAVFEDLDPAGLGATVTGPNGKQQELRFEKISKGHYQLELPGAQAGVYQVQLHTLQSKSDVRFTPVGFDVSGELFGERKGQGFNISFLERAARSTGGKVNPGQDELQGLTRTVRETVDLRPYLLVVSLLLFLIEILRREVGIRFLRIPLRAWARSRGKSSRGPL